MGTGGGERMSIPLPNDALERAVRNLPDNGESARRQAALASFATRGFPTLRDEDWKYTDLARVIDISRDWLMAGAPEESPALDAIRTLQEEIDAYWLVLANGSLVRDCSDLLSRPGIRFEAEPVPEAGFTAPLSDLNAALSRSAFVLRIGHDWGSDKPIVLLVADVAEHSAIASQVRLGIHLEESATASFVEYHRSAGACPHYSNVLIELDVARNAHCRYLRMQERALHHSQTARLDVRLARDARFEHFAADLGGELARNDLKVDVAERNADATLNGVYLAGHGQHVDNHTRIDHRVGPARSRQEYRGVLAGRCRAVWNGKAIVHKGADGTDAEQSNHNLLLSEHAEVDAKPELEIYADDVKCAHGTTVGQLDERALYYLRTRGIDEARAKRILTRAFAAAVIEALPITVLREYVGGRVEARIRALATGDKP
jgi:Fe-S cluster assembly protein SufD